MTWWLVTITPSGRTMHARAQRALHPLARDAELLAEELAEQGIVDSGVRVRTTRRV